MVLFGANVSSMRTVAHSRCSINTNAVFRCGIAENRRRHLYSVCGLVFETGSGCAAQAGLEFIILLQLLNAEVIGVCHHTWFIDMYVAADR